MESETGDIYSFSALWRHYRTCRRGKRTTANALAFEIDAEAKLLDLQRELRDHSYRPGRSILFITDGPKPREVFAADFRDRIVHHLLVWHQERIFEPRFIADSFACRVGKGTLAASDRLMTLLRRATANGHRAAWALQLDVASFFPSIDKRVLCRIVERQIHDAEIRWLTRIVLFHDPTRNYRYCVRTGKRDPPGTPGYRVAPAKSLFGKQGERGLPIGNLTSQFWGNVLMNELDQMIKRSLGCRYYLRYVDDMVLLSGDPAELERWRGAIECFLAERLHLSLRSGHQEPFEVRGGVDFVGWRTWWSRRLVRRRTVEGLRCRVRGFADRVLEPAFSGLASSIAVGKVTSPPRRFAGRRGSAASVVPCDVEVLRASLASYAGHLRHGAAYADWIRVWAEFSWLAALYERSGWQITERWQARGVCGQQGFGANYGGLIRHAGDDCLVFYKLGRFIEFYGPQRLLAERVLGLRRAAIPRGWYALTAGFPRRLAGQFATRALEAGFTVVLADHVAMPWGRSRAAPMSVVVPKQKPFREV